MEPNKNVVYQEVSGDLVLLDLDSESYFGLNPIGTRIWNLMLEGKNESTIVDDLIAEYDAEPAEIQADVSQLLSDLENSGLIVKPS